MDINHFDVCDKILISNVIRLFYYLSSNTH